MENIELLTHAEFSQLPLSSLLLFEKLLHRNWLGDDKRDEQEFMVNLIKEKPKNKLSGDRYSLYNSLFKIGRRSGKSLSKNC